MSLIISVKGCLKDMAYLVNREYMMFLRGSYEFIVLSAQFKSFFSSKMSSVPIDKRIKLSEITRPFRIALEMAACIIIAEWPARFSTPPSDSAWVKIFRDFSI